MNRPHHHRNAERLAADASALVGVSSPADWPGGFAVIPERLPPGVLGLTCGAGAGVATFYGLRPGKRAVLVDVFKFVSDLNAPTLAEVARFECTALHEAAHALIEHEATPATVETLVGGAMDKVLEYPAAKIARHHSPRWAVAFWLLANRAAAYRRATGRALVEHTAGGLAVYGYQRADLEQLARGVAADEPLAARLVAGGAWDTLLSDRLPDEPTRAAAIVAGGIARKKTEG